MGSESEAQHSITPILHGEIVFAGSSAELKARPELLHQHPWHLKNLARRAFVFEMKVVGQGDFEFFGETIEKRRPALVGRLLDPE